MHWRSSQPKPSLEFLRGMARSASRARGSSTITIEEPSPSERPQQTLVLRLVRPKKVSWKEGTIDNEFLQRKSSKKCCIFHKQKPFDEDDSDCDEENGGVCTKNGGNCSKNGVNSENGGDCSENDGDCPKNGGACSGKSGDSDRTQGDRPVRCSDVH